VGSYVASRISTNLLEKLASMQARISFCREDTRAQRNHKGVVDLSETLWLGVFVANETKRIRAKVNDIRL
jgi:hypothetical protein